jgi:hypothetical protein
MWRELFLWVRLFFFVVLLIIYFIIVMFKQTAVCVLLVMLCMSMTAVGQGLGRDVQIVGTNGEYPFGVLNDDGELNTAECNAKQWQEACLDAGCCLADVKFDH